MIGDNFFFLNSVESTNNYAMARIHAGLAKHGDVFLAKEQTAGKGQRGKVWNAEPGQNITMTAVLETEGLFMHEQFLLSAGIALGCFDFLTMILHADVKIKWPNDLYWRDRKAAGILIENIVKGNCWRYAVAGIGININQTSFPEGVKAVSVKQVTGKAWDVAALARELCACLENRWQLVIRKHSEKLLADYNDCLYKRNDIVKFRRNNIAFESRIREVSPDGELVTENEGLQSFKAGDLQWIIS